MQIRLSDVQNSGSSVNCSIRISKGYALILSDDCRVIRESIEIHGSGWAMANLTKVKVRCFSMYLENEE